MDWNLHTICEAFTMLPMWPVFDIFHFILMSINMKKDLITSVSFSYERKHPFACWFATMMLCNAGGIFGCLMLGKPLATLFMAPEKFAMATLIWYIINYVPGVFSLLTNRWVMCLVISMKEVHRVNGIYGGMSEASKIYSSYYLVLFVFGFLKGTAAEIMMFFARLAAGVLKPNAHQHVAPNVFLFPSCMFKASALVSAVFCLEFYSLIQISHSVLLTGIVVVLIYLRILMALGVLGDPFVPFENLFCAVAFGGMWNAYKRAVHKDQKSGATANGDSHHKVKKS